MPGVLEVTPTCPSRLGQILSYMDMKEGFKQDSVARVNLNRVEVKPDGSLDFSDSVVEDCELIKKGKARFGIFNELDENRVNLRISGNNLRPGYYHVDAVVLFDEGILVFHIDKAQPLQVLVKDPTKPTLRTGKSEYIPADRRVW